MTDDQLPTGEDGMPEFPPPLAPAMQRVDLDTVMTTLRDEINTTLSGMGADVRVAQNQLQTFLNTIAPDVDQAVGTGDLMSLNYLRDRVAMELGRASLGLINRERLAVTNTVATVVSLLIKFGIGAIALA